MPIRPSTTSGGGSKYWASLAPRPKLKDHPDIKVTSHKRTVQHSVRAQKLDERQLSKLFKSLDDLKIKRLLQIDKERAEQEQILEKLANERELVRERRVSTRGNSSRSTSTKCDLSSLMPDHFKRGPRPVGRGSSSFDLYAFMMHKDSDHTVSLYTKSTRVNKKTSGKSRKQLSVSPIIKTPFRTPVSAKDHGDSNLATEYRNVGKYHVVLPGNSDEMKLGSTSPVSITSLSRSVSIESLPPSTLNDNGVSATPAPKRFPSGTDWPGMRDVNKGSPRRAHQRTPHSKQLQNARGDGRKRQSQNNKKLGREGVERRRRVNAHDTAKTNGSRNEEVSVHFDDEEDQGGDALNGAGIAIGAGIMEKNNSLKDTNQPECKEPDCIFHNRPSRKANYDSDDEYTIDDYYRAVGAKSTVSPLFISAGSPRSWSRRGVVRPPSPNPLDILNGLNHGKTATEPPKSSPVESSSFLSVRRPLKGSNRERMLKDKEDNVRTTFNLMRKKMAAQKPPEFNQNYGTPTPNWKILNPLKIRHKINQSNPLHVRWGL